MFKEVLGKIREDSRLKFLLIVMFIVQVVTALNQPGFFHPDQHFQIVEFSAYQLGRETGATKVWELKAAVRPTVQVYVFSAYTKICEALSISDVYLQMTILRIILSILMFVVFTAITIYYLRDKGKTVIYAALFILNLSWFFPYIKTLFTSENLSALFFFIPLTWYHLKREKINNGWFVLLIGFLFGLAFYFRFQVGFALAGFGAWLLFVDKRYKDIPFLAIGFLLAVALNTYLDYDFYDRFVFTPYQYYHVNITEGKAASFGTSSFLQYIIVLLGFLTTPPLSIFLLYFIIKAVFTNYKHPFVLPVALFIIGHSLIAHKEERFLFPVFVVLPIVIGLALPAFIDYYKKTKPWIRNSIKGIAIFSIVLNLLMLGALLFNPFAQTVYFTSVLRNEFKKDSVAVFCYRRTPFQTESLLPLTYYRKSVTNINFIRFSHADSIRQLTGKPIYLTTTYNQVKNDRKIIDSLGYKPVYYSSEALWRINEFLDRKQMNTINDIWVLYKKD